MRCRAAFDSFLRLRLDGLLYSGRRYPHRSARLPESVSRWFVTHLDRNDLGASRIVVRPLVADDQPNARGVWFADEAILVTSYPNGILDTPWCAPWRAHSFSLGSNSSRRSDSDALVGSDWMCRNCDSLRLNRSRPRPGGWVMKSSQVPAVLCDQLAV